MNCFRQKLNDFIDSSEIEKKKLLVLNLQESRIQNQTCPRLFMSVRIEFILYAFSVLKFYSKLLLTVVDRCRLIPIQNKKKNDNLLFFFVSYMYNVSTYISCI